MFSPIPIQAIKVACSNCNLRELCMPVGLDAAEMRRLDDLVTTRRKIKRGAALFRHGERFTSLYAIRTGFFKTCVTTEDGRDQVTGFQMAGEIIGLDGIVVATDDKSPDYAFKLEHLYLGLSANVLRGGDFVKNPYKQWNEVGAELPAGKILVYGPPASSGTRDAWLDLAIEPGARKFPTIEAMRAQAIGQPPHPTMKAFAGGLISANPLGSPLSLCTVAWRRPMRPTTSVPTVVTADVPVIVLAMLRNSRCAPTAKTFSSRFSAV